MPNEKYLESKIEFLAKYNPDIFEKRLYEIGSIARIPEHWIKYRTDDYRRLYEQIEAYLDLKCGSDI